MVFKFVCFCDKMAMLLVILVDYAVVNFSLEFQTYCLHKFLCSVN